MINNGILIILRSSLKIAFRLLQVWPPRPLDFHVWLQPSTIFLDEYSTMKNFQDLQGVGQAVLLELYMEDL